MAHGGARPGAGRRKGSLNKSTIEVAEKLAALGCDPFEGMARIALQQAPCPTCKGAGKFTFSFSDRGPYADPDKGTEATCFICLGTGFEPITAELRGKMHAELAQYVAPKRKAVEVGGPDGKPAFHTVINLAAPEKVERS